MGYLGNYRDSRQRTAEIQAHVPAQLDTRGSIASRAPRHRRSHPESPFRLRPNYAGGSQFYRAPGASNLCATLFALFLAACGAAQAANINARSPSLADV